MEHDKQIKATCYQREATIPQFLIEPEKVGVKWGNRSYNNKAMFSAWLQLNKANTFDTEAPLLDLHLSISYGFVSCKIYDKRDAFDFDIVNFPFF